LQNDVSANFVCIITSVCCPHENCLPLCMRSKTRTLSKMNR
jgi:hypothetical protein